MKKGFYRPRRPKGSVHADWLSLVEVSGPFFTLEVLDGAFPQGVDAVTPEFNRYFRSLYQEWCGEKDQPGYHRAWLQFILHELLEYPAAAWREGGQIPPGCSVRLAQHGETLVPDGVLMDGEAPRLLWSWYPPSQKLQRPVPGRSWVASPLWRMVELLHGTGKRLGVVSNGEHFAVVSAPLGEPSGTASFYAEIWHEEPVTLSAFRTLFGGRRFLGVELADGPEALLEKSSQQQHEVTTSLGRQVRQAVELLVSELDRENRARDGELLQGLSERELFQGALTVMMRLVFLLSAEERGLLPLEESELYREVYAVSTLADQLREAADQHTEELLERRQDAWVRLLATFRAVFAGVQHEDLHLPAYGGSLFDPDRYPFLEGRAPGTEWLGTPARPLPIQNRQVLYLLESLQQLKTGADHAPRRVSFRALDVEQLGHVYESLLDHTVRRSDSTILGFQGAGKRVPEVELVRLEEAQRKGVDAVIELLHQETAVSDKTLRKKITYPPYSEDPRLFMVCDGDANLYTRVRPYVGLLREDPLGNKLVVPPGGAYVTQGSDRRDTGTHYTPRSLTEEMVKHALDPLLYEGMSEGVEPSAERLVPAARLLDLKVLDLAMGSGAFLVQACRYLAERLVEVWERDGVPDDVPREPEARLAVARRRVAESCLYGVDRDPLAVEMAKLSLWLLTLDRQKPFSFVDHALRCGDSLLGVTSEEQLEKMSLRPGEGEVSPRFSQEQVRTALGRARAARRELESFEVVDPRDAQRKAALLRQAEEATAELRRLGDLLVAEALGAGALEALLAVPDPPVARWLNAGKPEGAPERVPFHWALEFPEVMERGGFDAIVGNPPFVGGQKITGSQGTDYREVLVENLASGKRGSADLVAYFFLRGCSLLRQGGTLGMLATNTLAQGDTREVGLDQLTTGGYCIYRAKPSRRWPGTANLEVAEAWLHRGPWTAPYWLDQRIVSAITSTLGEPRRVTGKPYPLPENAGRSFQGSIVLGQGFVLSIDEAAALLESDPRNADVLFPYINGVELNSHIDQAPRRWIINFLDRTLEQASLYGECIEIVRERVKPERDCNQYSKSAREKWWLFERSRSELYSGLRGLRRALARALTGKHNAFCFVNTGTVFDQTAFVFLYDDGAHFAVLQSDIHYQWVLSPGGMTATSLRTDPRYSLSDGFDTFPFPYEVTTLDDIGERYHEHRRQVMLARQEGLTKTYNRFHDPAERSEDIQTLRDLHREMDEKVAAAYGWTLDLGHGFHETKQGLRYTLSPAARQEVLDLLLELNHERARAEQQAAPPPKKKGRKAAPERQMDLTF